MKRISCPYLGLKDDPTTSLGFPSDGNYCHHLRPIAPIKGSYQEKYCLSAEHSACSIYKAANPQPATLALVAPGYLRGQGRRVAAVLGIPAILVILAVIGIGLGILGSRMDIANLFIPKTGGISRESLTNLIKPPQPTITPFSPANQDAAVLPQPQGQPLPTNPNCPMPKGWMTYVVNPTDSLFRLSVVYGASVEALQASNCMGSQTVILPGQVIYVPFVASPTPDPSNQLAILPQLVATNTLPQFGGRATAAPSATSLVPVGPAAPGATVVPTASSTPVPSNTAVPPPTNTVRPTATRLPTNTSLPPTAVPTTLVPPTPTLAGPSPVPPTPVPPTVAPSTPIPPTLIPPSPVPPTPIPPTPVLPTPVPPTPVPPTPIPPTPVPPTPVPPTPVPPTPVPPTPIPPTPVPPTPVPPTPVPPTPEPPTPVPPTPVPPTPVPPTPVPDTPVPATPIPPTPEPPTPVPPTPEPPTPVPPTPAPATPAPSTPTTAPVGVTLGLNIPAE